MNVPDPLPDDVESCHTVINQLLLELAETRRKLAVHEENERRQMEWRYGKGVTAEKLLSFGQRIEQMHAQRRPRERKK